MDEPGTMLVPAREPETEPLAGNAIYGIVTSAEGLADVRQRWIDAKRAELARGKAALEGLTKAGAGEVRINAVKDRVGMIKKVVRALEAGYVPIPRFDSETLNLDLQPLPAPALVAISAARDGKLFHEIRFVRGRQETSGRGWSRARARDPLVIGIIRSSRHVLTWHVDGESRWPRDVIPVIEEHFMVAWWQPSDERAEMMF